MPTLTVRGFLEQVAGRPVRNPGQKLTWREFLLPFWEPPIPTLKSAADFRWSSTHAERRISQWFAGVDFVFKYQADHPQESIPADVAGEILTRMEEIPADDKHAEQKLFNARCLNYLFQLHMGPVRSSLWSALPRQGQAHEFSQQFHPIHAPIDQLTFIDPVPSKELIDDPVAEALVRPLDSYARDIATSSSANGIHALAGGRGAGKSSVLNRIEWYCNNWVRRRGPDNLPQSKDWRPVLVRFDLAGTLDAKKFGLDLMAEVCQAVQTQVHSLPVSHGAILDFFRNFLGNLGKFFAMNWLWFSFAIALIFAVAIAADRYGQELETFFKLKFTLPYAAGAAFVWLFVASLAVGYTASRRYRRLWADVHPLWIPAVPVLVLGAWGLALLLSQPALTASTGVSNEFFWRNVKSLAPPQAKTQASTSATGDLPVTVNVTVSPLAAGTPATGQAPSLYSLAILVAALSLATGYAMLFLPQWWWAYDETSNYLVKLRLNEGPKTGMDLTIFGPLTNMLRALLPQMPGAVEEIQHLDLTSQQEVFKAIVRICVDAFQRVVFLIDDVDVLKRQQFPQLLQMLRPLSKVDGVCCVIAVPKYFYYGLKLKNKNDLHSTFGQVRLLGDPRFQIALDKQFTSTDGKSKKSLTLNSILKPILTRLLRSKLRLRLSGPKQEIAFVQRLLVYWDISEQREPLIREALRSEQPSRREFLRETQRILDAVINESPADHCQPWHRSDDPESDAKDFVHWRGLYGDAEEALYG